LHFGVGKGGTQQEAGTFGYNLDELQPMIDEAMYLIPKIMVQDEIEHHGKYITIPKRPIHPSPFQDPHPPMYMACTRENTLLAAGSRGIGALVLGFSGPDEIAKKNAIYREAYRTRKAGDQVGFRPTEHLAALCAATVLDDREKARQIGTRGQRFFAESIAYWYQGCPKPTVDDNLTAEDHAKSLEAGKQATIAFMSEEAIPIGDEHLSNYNVAQDAYGTPDDCIRYVQRLKDAGADEILFLFQMGGIPHDIIMETIRNIGEKVIPHFHAADAAAKASELEAAE